MIKNYEKLENIAAFKFFASIACKLTPNQISIIGFNITLLTSSLIISQFYLLSVLTIALHLICDGLDGYVARKYHKSSQFGFLVDHILDRISDLIIFPSVGFSVGLLLPGILVSIICLFSSYIGVLQKIIGADQDKSGLFGKANRYIALMIVLALFTVAKSYQPQIFLYYCYASGITGVITIITRTRSLLNNAKKEYNP